MHWLVSEISAFSRSKWICVVIFSLFACQARDYKEKEIRVVLPSAPENASSEALSQDTQQENQISRKVDRRKVDRRNEIGRKEIRRKWNKITKLFKKKNFSERDVTALFPESVGFKDRIDSEEPANLLKEVTELEKSVRETKISAEFVKEKLRRARKLLKTEELQDDQRLFIKEQIKKIRRLIRKRKYKLAHQGLTEVQDAIVAYVIENQTN